jgi:hypothetical protein
VSHHHDDKKKTKKALQLKKNRLHFEIFNVFRQQREEAERLRQKEEEARAGKSTEISSENAWGDKVAVVRNRLTDKKRVSRERWNRFAGTEGGGGRGL